MVFHRSWSPNGYDRATELFERGYYDHSHFFRVVPHFLVQFGISYTDDAELKHFADTTIPDDPKRQELMPFREGMLSFAGSGPNSRNSQMFIAYDGAGGLGKSPWETPFGEVVEGIENVRNLYSGYGDMPPWGKGPEQGPIRNRGPSYIEENFTMLDKFETCTVKKIMPANSDTVAKLDAGADRNGPGKGTETKSAHLPKNKEGEPSLLSTPSKIFIAIIIAVVLVILHQILKRRKTNKQAKSV